MELAEAANLSNRQFNEAARLLLEGEQTGEIQLPMANRGAYETLLSEDWDPLDYVERSSDYTLSPVATVKRKAKTSRYHLR